MPSLRKRVSSYFRQLSFHNESREKRHNINENSFVTKYLQGNIQLKDGPPIIYGRNPTDLPNFELRKYDSGSNSIIGCYSGPNGGLTAVKRTEKHLSVLDADIDYIDTQDEIVQPEFPKKSTLPLTTGLPIDNTTMVIKVAGHEYCVTNKQKKSHHNKSHSMGSISDFHIEIEKTKIDKDFYNNSNSNNNCDDVLCKNFVNCDLVNNTKEGNKCSVSDCDKNQKELAVLLTMNEECANSSSSSSNEPNERGQGTRLNCEEKLNASSIENSRRYSGTHPGGTNSRKSSNDGVKQPLLKNKTDSKQRVGGSQYAKSYELAKSKSEGNPFHQKRGKIIKIVHRANIRAEELTDNAGIPSVIIDDSTLPNEWNKKSNFFYGISDSLYDRNQVTKNKNGDPIADCFGIIARNDSAILAVADGVNWGEKASIAAKSAIHGCLHYLNKTIFHDTKPFENLTIHNDESSTSSSISLDPMSDNLISNTREVFVCLLRAFNCAHDLILENNGMLTTLTVAVVLPLKQKMQKREDTQDNQQYVCCVCNVGDTLAYVYSQKYGIRELTKGSHDIYCNRDMRDALGALGPVDGINPELSNLTLSITTLHKGDIVLVASDGLTDNFDPNVCKFTVNSNVVEATTTKPKTSTPSSSASRTPRDAQSHHIQKIHGKATQAVKTAETGQKPPMKPPRRSKLRDDSASNRSSAERTSVKSTSISVESESLVVDNLNKCSISNTPPLDSKRPQLTENSRTQKSSIEYENPLVAAFMRENSVDESPKHHKNMQDKKNITLDSKKSVVLENKASSLRRQASNQGRQGSQAQSTSANKNVQISTGGPKGNSTKDSAGYKFLRSKTSVDIKYVNSKYHILRNEDGIPYVTPIQRYELQLLLMEDVLKNGISGTDSPCTSAKRLCENLLSFTISITNAKRRTLEDPELYFDNRSGVLVEVSQQEKKMRRKKGLERVQNLPGKLDHVSIVAYNVGNFESKIVQQ